MLSRELLKLLHQVGFTESDLKVSSKRIMVCCPFAKERHVSGEDLHPSFSITISSRNSFVYCFGCGYKGQLGDFFKDVCETRGIEKAEILEKVANTELYGYAWSDEDIEEEEPEEFDIAYAEKKVNSWRGKITGYMQSRGYTSDDISIWDLGFDSDRNTMTLPIRDQYWNLVGATGRFVSSNVDQKYYHYFNFKKANYVVGAQLVRPGTKVLLTEGTLDLIPVRRLLQEHKLLNEYSVIATMGSEVSTAQLDIIVGISERVILFNDNDKAGKKSRRKLYRGLNTRVGVWKMDYPEGTEGLDPDDVATKYPSLFKHMLDTARFVF